RDDGRGLQPVEGHATAQPHVEAAVGQAARVAGHFVARGSAAAATELRQLRMDEHEGQLVARRARPLTEPGALAVDLEPERAQVPDLAHVQARERTLA